MHVLVTGSTGFVGRALVPALLQAGHHVRAAMRRAPSLFPAEVEPAVHGDLGAETDWPALLQGIDAIVHLAGIAHTRSANDDAYDRINHVATARLAADAAAAGVQRFVFISSIRAQSGPTATHALSELDQPRPTDAYGRSKLAAEQAVRSSGVPFTILRPVVIYGAGVKGNIAMLLRLCRSPWPLPFGAMTAPRSVLATDNLISAIEFALCNLSAVNETFIVADEPPLTLADMVVSIRASTGKAPRLLPVAPSVLKAALTILGQRQLWERIGAGLVARPAKLIAAGWHPRVTSREGLKKLGQFPAQ